ncbi:MAG: T5orf172 domain protein [Spirochaetes bacterium ADurb.BinA120]|nr:MAG: T5orf172 domain protein [Spirochaetes bacterium ADurb.BinA120]
MGKVYIFTNDAMPGIIKIGITEGSVEDRIKTLDNTSVPLPFRFHYAIESDRFKEIEAFIHNAFGAFRLRENREFFKLDPERAVSALKISGCAEIKIGNEMIDEKGEIIKEDETIEKKYKKRFSFAVVNVPIGSFLTLRVTKIKNVRLFLIMKWNMKMNDILYQGLQTNS